MRREGEGWAVGPGPEGGGGSVDFTLPDFVLPPPGNPSDPTLSFGHVVLLLFLVKKLSTNPTVGPLSPWSPPGFCSRSPQG